MKKHDEGYALVLVLVILTVVGILASFMLSFALNHLQTQRGLLNRMQDEYTAAGKIEAVVGQLEALMETGSGTVLLEDAEVSPDDKTIEITAKAGTVQIQCEILLTAEVRDLGSQNYEITNFTGMEYLSYEVSTVQGGDAS